MLLFYVAQQAVGEREGERRYKGINPARNTSGMKGRGGRGVYCLPQRGVCIVSIVCIDWCSVYCMLCVCVIALPD